MKTTIFAIAGMALLSGANASCPNSCSGHGSCGRFDMCSCFRNWAAADCSERVCPYDWSFVTTPQGDLNMDGDSYDGMLYTKSSHYIDTPTITAAESKTNLLTVAMPGGDWEMWPSYGSFTTTDGNLAVNFDEAHFYMECSNRGLCNRELGECECFEGYEGSACRRTVCPNGCSGHGTCESVNSLTSGSNYKLWDGDKSMSCKCDPGFGAADCSERQCPKGDDPLTTSTSAGYDQKNENVWIDVDQVGDSVTPAGGADISGYIQLQYADDFGETWWSDFIGPMAKFSGTPSENTALAAKVKTGFTGIPNGVFETVTVTAEQIDNVLPGTITGGNAAVAITLNDGDFGGANALYATAFGCGAATGYCDQDAFPLDYALVYKTVEYTITKGASWWATPNVPITASLADAADADTVLQRSLRGIRFKVNFTSNPGDLNDFSCVTTERFSDTETKITPGTCAISSRILALGSASIAGAAKALTVGTDLSSLISVGSRVTISDGAYVAATNPGETFTVAAVSWANTGTLSITTVEAAVASYVKKNFYINLDGTTESSECSDRGLCDHELGTCACFIGYTSNNCGRQTTLLA